MTEKMVRCPRCHDVFDAAEGICPRCGTTYEPVAPLPDRGEGFFVEKYSGTPFQPQPDPRPEPVPRTGPSLLVGAGVAFVIVALVFGGLVFVNAFGSSPAPTLQAVVARSNPPTPPPTLPPSITKTLAQFADPEFNAHVYVNSRATVSSRISTTGQSYTLFSSLDATVEAGNEAGTLTIGGIATDFTLMSGVLSTRSRTSGHYAPVSTIPSYYLLLPLFDLTDAKMLQYAGDLTSETGETLHHLVSTPWWTPDKTKLAVLDVATLPEKIEKLSLDMSVKTDGTPVSATFTAWTDATNGEHLVQIVTTYSFADVGSAGPIVAPTA
jgi:hypothetical protein